MGSDHPPESNEMKPDGRPFVIPCHDLTFAAPWRWQRLGCADVRREPALNFLFGLIIVIISPPI